MTTSTPPTPPTEKPADHAAIPNPHTFLAVKQACHEWLMRRDPTYPPRIREAEARRESEATTR